MRLSHVLVIAAASFLFASEAIAVTMDSEITVARDGLSQRRLRSYNKPAKDDDSDDSAKRGFTAEEDDESDEERGFSDRFTPEQLERLREKAEKLGYNFKHIESGTAKFAAEDLKAWQTHLNIIIKENKRAETAAHNANWRRKNGITD
ncbi:putative secreted RxLR effector protein [Phytophthora cinnamomi]|uniref:putative secreted RxLR effector protein n=1 Tax=Phytophthora cinnamomi TaxID=4785 RepID=UPI00355A02EE|nr:putative secreted RxLR effector protein [Phytophthora cinnamomi]